MLIYPNCQVRRWVNGLLHKVKEKISTGGRKKPNTRRTITFQYSFSNLMRLVFISVVFRLSRCALCISFLPPVATCQPAFSRVKGLSTSCKLNESCLNLGISFILIFSLLLISGRILPRASITADSTPSYLQQAYYTSLIWKEGRKTMFFCAAQVKLHIIVIWKAQSATCSIRRTRCSVFAVLLSPETRDFLTETFRTKTIPKHGGHCAVLKREARLVPTLLLLSLQPKSSASPLSAPRL